MNTTTKKTLVIGGGMLAALAFSVFYTVELEKPNSLLQKLTEAVDPEEREKLVIQLGEQKKTEAVPYLVTRIADVMGSSSYNGTHWEKTFPCYAALIQIGNDSVPQIQKQFTTAALDAQQQLLLLDALFHIKGKQFTVDWLDTLEPKEHPNIPVERFNELKHWVQSLEGG